ncbi:MAG: amino acid ABC transporter substrate-binding protein [Pseudomonadota bacterium]
MIRSLVAAGLSLFVAASAQADALQEILDRESITLGIRSSAPPFSYLDEEGAPAGLAVSLCNAVVREISRHQKTRLGIAYKVVDAKQRFPALINRETDLHCGPASATLERREILDFSIIYFVDGASAAVRPDGSFDTVFDADGSTFGALGGTTTMGVVEDLIARNSLDAKIKQFDSHGAGLSELAAGEIDVYFGDQAILFFQIESLGLIDEVQVFEDVFSFEPYALAMKRGEDDLRLAVDRALSKIYETGLIYQMILNELDSYPLSTEAKTLYLVVGLPE